MAFHSPHSSSSSSTSSAADEKLKSKWQAVESRGREVELEKLSQTAKAGGYDVSVHLEWEKALGEHDDMDYISEKEKETVTKLKVQVSAATEEATKNCIADMTNRELAIFLIARKWNIDRTIELLKGYKSVRAEFNFPPRVSLSDVPSSFFSSPFCFTPCLFDTSLRPLTFIIIRNFSPAIHTFAGQMALTFFLVEKLMLCLPLVHWRRGLVYIEDLAGASLSGLRQNDAAKSLKVLQNALPLRVNKLLIVHAPWVLRAMYAVGKLFMKQTLLDRVALVGTAELKHIVPEAALLKEWGGTLQLVKEEDFLQKETHVLPDLKI